MDLEETVFTLQSKCEQLWQENNQLKAMLGVVRENQDLKARMQSFSHDTLMDPTVSSPSGRNGSSLWQNTFSEKQFRENMQQTRFKHEHRTSSPINFRSFLQTSMHTDPSELQSFQADIPPKVKAPDRLLGEIAYQLDRRILSHIFQGHKRLYGFTLLNIPDKIIEVSQQPLTGKVDEGYRLHLSQRYDELMERLNKLGYKATLHPQFSEFIVNTYGILKERPGENSTQEMDYNNPEYLGRLIMTTAPRKLQKDLLLMLTCLCNMAEIDRKPLLLW
ncbi:speriolin-like protein [Larimichthys crocea]|uniref:speriolin-like protein n=1 Tax=Larimichthys crocea TaxID=215358 RepID=UPI0009019BD4|nr:speriolin-like protein [Larimichthys crocea]